MYLLYSINKLPSPREGCHFFSDHTDCHWTSGLFKKRSRARAWGDYCRKKTGSSAGTILEDKVQVKSLSFLLPG